jgi:glucokinase
VVSWWKHPRSQGDSGTPIEWLRELRKGIVEVHCECAPQLAVERFRRRERHPGHLDGRWSKEELLAQMTDAARLGPLQIGALVQVDTGGPIDFAALWEQVQRASRRTTPVG